MTTQWMNLKGPEGKGLQLRKAVWAELQEIGTGLQTGTHHCFCEYTYHAKILDSSVFSSDPMVLRPLLNKVPDAKGSGPETPMLEHKIR